MRPSGQTILVAVDPSPAATAAFRQGMNLAASMRAQLAAVSVSPPYEGIMNRWKIDDANEQMAEPYRQCLLEATATAQAVGLSLRTFQRMGDPVDEITAVAEAIGADLLLMGYPRRSYVKRLILGRTTAGVLGISPCDVLMIPEGAEIGFDRILVGIDGSQCGTEAGRAALDLALAYGGEVHALTVVDIPVDRSLLFGVLGEVRHKHFSALQTLAAQGEKLQVPVISELREGSPYEELVRYGQEKEVQLIVLGCRGRTAFPSALPGGVVERVTELSQLPTLVVQKPGQAQQRNPLS